MCLLLLYTIDVARIFTMIRTFKSKVLERYWSKNDARGIRPDQVDKVTLILAALNQAQSPTDLDRPSFGFHALHGNMAGRFAVRVNKNWRITFAWDASGPFAIDVNFEDYH